jgi:hypothetical protein
VSFAVPGTVLLLAAMGIALWAVARRAGREGVLAPIAVGFAVRLAVTVAAYVTSRLTGHDGFLYFDDRGYADAGSQLAARWLDLHPGNPLEPLGILPHGGPLFYQLVAGVFLLTGDSMVAMLLVNVVLGTATVLFTALLAKAVLGATMTRRAAWVVALAPTIVWWTAPMLRESLATFLAIAALLAASRLPSWRASAATVVLLAALALTRATLFAAVAGGVAAWAVALGVTSPIGERGRRVGALLAVLAVTGGFGVLLASGGTGDVDQIGAVSQSISTSRDMPSNGNFDSSVIADVAGGTLPTYGAAAVRFFTSPRAWAFGEVPLDWYQPLYPAMWLWYALIPVALGGLWAIRRRWAALALLALPIVLIAAQYTLALNSGVRQRSGIEPLLALLIVAGWTSVPAAALGAGVVFLVLAPVVAIDLNSALAAIPLVIVGVALVAAAKRRRRPHTPATT